MESKNKKKKAIEYFAKGIIVSYIIGLGISVV